jgi:CRISPR/Cas system endoribonuclease Cas6 (RAMP superfamily)
MIKGILRENLLYDKLYENPRANKGFTFGIGVREIESYGDKKNLCMVFNEPRVSFCFSASNPDIFNSVMEGMKKSENIRGLFSQNILMENLNVHERVQFEKNEVVFKTLSPVSARKMMIGESEKNAVSRNDYILPGESDFEEVLLFSLLSRLKHMPMKPGKGSGSSGPLRQEGENALHSRLQGEFKGKGSGSCSGTYLRRRSGRPPKLRVRHGGGGEIRLKRSKI